MTATTRETFVPKHDSAPPQAAVELLNTALLLVLQGDPAHVVCPGRETRTGGPGWRTVPGAGPDANFYPVGLHDHPHLEVYVILRGNGLLRVAGRGATPARASGPRCLRLSPGTVILLPAGVVHAEGFADADDTYQSLWLSLAGGFLMPFVACHAPGETWKLLYRRRLLQSRYAKALAGRVPKRGSRELPDAAREAARVDVIAVIAELIHLETCGGRGASRLDAASRRNEQLVQDAIRTLSERLDQPLAVETLARSLHLSGAYLNRLFTQVTGHTVHRYLLALRMQLAMSLRREGLLVKQVARRVGYDDPAHFSRAFRHFFGVWPTDVTPAPTAEG